MGISAAQTSAQQRLSKIAPTRETMAFNERERLFAHEGEPSQKLHFSPEISDRYTGELDR